MSVTLFRILRLAEIVAVCHLAPLVRSVSRQRMPGLLNEDAKKSWRGYRSDMIDVSLFLIRYESPNFVSGPPTQEPDLDNYPHSLSDSRETAHSVRTACPLRARPEGQERYLADTHGQPQMPPDLQRAGQRGMTIQFPS